MAPFNWSVTVRHDCVAVTEHAQYQDLETGADVRNPAILHCIIYTCAVFFVLRHIKNVCCGQKGLLICYCLEKAVCYALVSAYNKNYMW